MWQCPPLHEEPSAEELAALTIAAKEAALAGRSQRVELYRTLGVSLASIAPAVGASANLVYAKALIAQNPQYPHLDLVIAQGAGLAGNRSFIQELIPEEKKRRLVLAQYHQFFQPKKGAFAYPGLCSGTRHQMPVSTIQEIQEDKKNEPNAQELHAVHQAARSVHKRLKPELTESMKARLLSRLEVYKVLGVYTRSADHHHGITLSQ